MSKRLVITEEERNEIRGKYNLKEQSMSDTQKCLVRGCSVEPGSENKIKNFIITKKNLPLISTTGNPLLNGKKSQKGAIITPETTISVGSGESIVFGNNSFGNFKISYNENGNTPVISYLTA